MFVNAVVDNKESYNKQQIKFSEKARELFASLGYPSVQYYKWFIQRNQIKDFQVTVHEIYVAHKIWVKSVPYLKVKTTRKKHIPMTGDLLHLP